jgi:hypothetical protein
MEAERMSKTIIITILATVADEVDPDSVAGKLFDFLADDPDDVLPELETIDGYNGEVHQ